MKYFFIAILLLPCTIISAQSEYLQSGPMVSYSTMMEVGLWAQTTESADVYFEYWVPGNPGLRYKTEVIQTTKEKAFVAFTVADLIEPGTTYNYSLYINDAFIPRPYPLEFETQSLWQWRNDAPDFTFATGSCAFVSEAKYDRPGKPYGSGYQIFDNIYTKDPNFMLWLGDNVYLREADWNSKTGIQYRYTHTRSIAEMQALLGSVHHYGIWDDHDYGHNNSDRSYPLKDITQETFRSFFPSPNYTFKEGITSHFHWSDCEFFLLDNRYWRTPNDRLDIEEHEILGDEQIEWLIDKLVNSWAPFKFIAVGNPFINPLETKEIFNRYGKAERLKILNAIKELDIRGVIFLTGDVHHTELSMLDLEGAYPIYDLTVSPLTSGVGGHGAEDNPLQVDGTLLKQKNFGLLSVSGATGERVLTIEVFDTEGVLLWTKEIEAKNLRAKRKK